VTDSEQADPFGRLIDVADGLGMPGIEINSKSWRQLCRDEFAFGWTRRLFACTGVVAKIEQWLESDKAQNPDHRSGRPPGITVEGLFVCLFLLKRNNQALTHAAVGEFMCNSLTANQRSALGISEVQPDPTQEMTKSRCKADEEAMAARVGRLMGAICELLNAEPYRQPSKCRRQLKTDSTRSCRTSFRRR